MASKFNPTDPKWAHPESFEEGWYTIDMSQSDYRNLAKLSGDEAKAIVDGLDAGLREQMGVMAGLPPFNELAWEDCIVDKGCPVEPDAPALKVMVLKPKDVRPDERLPVVFCIPGGGLCSGGDAAQSGFLGTLALASVGVRCVRVCAEYRIANVAPYPAAVNDCHAVYQWMVENAESLNIDTDKIVIWGTSTGGQLGLALPFRLRDYNWCGAPMPRGVVAHVPVIDDVAFNNSNLLYFDNEDGTKSSWDSEAVQVTYKVYLGDRYGDPTLSPEAVPARAMLDDIRAGFPPVWIPGEAEFDACRDSTIRFARMLHEAGVFCDLHVWGGTSHQAFTASQTDFGQRLAKVIAGSLRDAMTYDFRRPWLIEE